MYYLHVGFHYSIFWFFEQNIALGGDVTDEDGIALEYVSVSLIPSAVIARWPER